MRAFVGCRAHSMNLGMAPSLAPLGQRQRVRQEGTEGDLKLLKTQKNLCWDLESLSLFQAFSAAPG